MSRQAARHIAAACASILLLCPSGAASVELGLDRAVVAEAVRLGRSDQSTRDRFHAAYRIPVDDPVIVELTLVTEFRALVLLTEERERLRDTAWSVERAANAASARSGRLEIGATLRFNPRNTYRAVPAYTLVIYSRGAGRPLAALDNRTTPAYVGGQLAPPGTPILGATLSSEFDATRLDFRSPCVAAVLLDGREVRRIPLDLGSIR